MRGFEQLAGACDDRFKKWTKFQPIDQPQGRLVKRGEVFGLFLQSFLGTQALFKLKARLLQGTIQIIDQQVNQRACQKKYDCQVTGIAEGVVHMECTDALILKGCKIPDQCDAYDPDHESAAPSKQKAGK